MHLTHTSILYYTIIILISSVLSFDHEIHLIISVEVPFVFSKSEDFPGEKR